MKNPFKCNHLCVTMLLLILALTSCSESTSTSNNQNSETTSPETKVFNASALTRTACDRPLNIYISNAAFQSTGNYQLTYLWNGVNNATAYEFEFMINGTAAFQNLAVTDTFITFTQAITASDSINATVRTVCGSDKSTSSKESAEIVYLNAISTDDIVYLASPGNSVDDICSRNCERVMFTGNSIKNSDGSTILFANPAMKVYYYDFNTVKTCIQCSGGAAPLVDPVAFNSCLNNPLNQYRLYDPGEYTVCP